MGLGRVAVFVDAGYLFAQGSTALAGSKQERAHLDLNETAALTELSQVHTAKAPGIPLLRVYWYDGVSVRGPSTEQARLAHTENVKVRLGFINSFGHQKGVDSLIVTDLIDLARNGAISDAVLLSGDEDVRLGVQIAQSFGVRVHLIGITPSRGSQSRQLRQEADTTTEWDRITVAKFLALRVPAPASPTTPTQSTAPLTATVTASAASVAAAVTAPIAAQLASIANTLASALTTSDLAGCAAYWKTQRGVPGDFDGKLIARGRAEIGRDLSVDEKRHIRRMFTSAVRARLHHA